MITSEPASSFGPDGLSERRLQALAWAFQASPDLVFVAGLDGRVLFANDAARARWTELTASVRAATLFPADLRALFAELEASVLEKGQAGRFEWGDHGPSGARSWFGCTLSPIADAGATVGYLSVSSDVTSLKRASERLRHSEELMVDTQGVAHLGTWEWDISEPNASWSAELYRIYGLSPETYVPSYENYLKMVHADDRPRVMEATNRVFHEHVPYSHDERIFRPDGSMRYLHTWAHPVLADNGQLVRLVGVCQDITDQKLAEEEVKRLNADLERRVAERTLTIENSVRDLQAFNAMASHDLRAPLSVIQGSCALLQASATPLPDLVAHNVARIGRSVTHMTLLLNDLLTLARVGHAPLTRTRVDVSALCHDIVAQLRLGSPDRQVTVTVQPDLSCVGDAELMRAAMDNLLGNAWKYSSRVEHARVEVGATPIDGRSVFYVRDNGAGFDMKDAHRLFAPFERLHKSSEFEGTGVGLAAVRRIVERHGGRVWAASEPDQGATFYFEVAPPVD